MNEAVDYLSPAVPAALPWHETPIVRATNGLLEGYGRLVDDPGQCPIEIVRWPASGRRPVDPDTGDQGGTAVGEFAFRWEGDTMFGRNTAVGDQYLLGWSRNPGEAQSSGEPSAPRDRRRRWHANYHPDGGQLFFPRNAGGAGTLRSHRGGGSRPRQSRRVARASESRPDLPRPGPARRVARAAGVRVRRHRPDAGAPPRRRSARALRAGDALCPPRAFRGRAATHGGFASGPVRPEDAVAQVDDAAPIARYLSSHLLDPLAGVLRTKRRWTIAPDAAIARLPFETLPWRGQPAVRRHDIAYVQSLSVLSLLASRERRADAGRPATVLAMGAPRYEISPSVADAKAPIDSAVAVAPERLASLALRGGDAGASRRLFDRRGIRWPELPGAARGVDAVAKQFPGSRVITRSQASEATLQELDRRDELSRYRYLLFATHGYLSLDAPNMSAVVLAQDQTTPAADGYVTAAEWPAYDLRSELAVLSACETGRGKTVQGEGIVGLPFAMAVAGNQATVLTLWQVVDASSARFVARLFGHVRSGMDKRAALARTKRAFIADPRLRAPLHWAGFVYYGE